MLRIQVKNPDQHPEDLPPILELYKSSTFCIIGGGILVPAASVPTPHMVQPLALGALALYGLMAPSIAVAPQPPTVALILMLQQVTSSAAAAPPAVDQPLPFTLGVKAEEFSTLLAKAIADKLSPLLSNNRPSTPRDRPPQGGSNCNFCDQGNHFARDCATASRYLTEKWCRKNVRG